MTDAQKIALDRYEQLQSLSQFKMLDKVEIIDWFYKGQKGVIFAEVNLVRDPKQDTNEIYPEWICTAYIVALQDEEDKVIDRREVEARHIVLQS